MSKYTANPKKYLQAALDNLYVMNIERSDYFTMLNRVPEPKILDFDDYEKSLHHRIVNMHGEQILTTITSKKISGEIYSSEKIFFSFDIGNYAVLIVHHKDEILASIFEIEPVYTIIEESPMLILSMKAPEDYKFLFINADLVNKKLLELAYRIELLYNYYYLTYFKKEEDRAKYKTG